MATAGRSFEVKFTGNTKGLTNSFKQAQKEAGALSKSVAGAGTLVKTAFAGIATAGIASGFKNTILAASNLQESLSKTTAVFGANASEIQKWAKTTSTSFGVSQQAALEAAGTYGNLFKAFGLSDTQATKMSKSLVELAADMASFNNVPIEDALLALRSGLSGETEPLKKFGVALNDQRLKEEALRLGLIKTTKGVLPVAIKTQAAYALIMKDTALQQGDVARTSGGLANQMKFLQSGFKDAQASLGNLFLPMLTDLVTTINKKIVPAIQDFVDQLQLNGVGAGLESLSANFRDILRNADGTLGKIRDVVIALISIKAATTIVMGLRGAWLAVTAAEAATATAAVITAGVIKRAMISTGIGALVVALGFVIDKILMAEYAAKDMGSTMTTEQKVATIGFTNMRYAVGGVVDEIDAAALAATRLSDAADDAARKVAVATGRKITTAATKKKPTTTSTTSKATKDTNKFADAQKTAADVVTKLNARLEDLRGKLASAKEAYATFASSVAESIRSTLNYQTAYESTGGFIKGLEDQARNAINFGSKIATLISMGLNESSISQILATGADTGSKIADEIIAGGAASIAKVNDLTKAVDSVAVNVGKVGASQFYQAGVSQAQAMVNGFVSALKTAGFGFVDGQVALPSKLAKGLEKGKLTKAQQKQLSGMLNNGKALETSKIAGQQYQVQANPTAFPVSGTTTQVVNNITVTAGVGDPVAIGKQVVDSLVAYQKKNGVIPVKTKTA